jgi:hypothetical protein
MRVLVTPVVAFTAFAMANPVWACGVSGPDGNSGCNLAEHVDTACSPYHVGVSGIYTSTAFRFRGDNRGDETRLSTLGSFAYAPTCRVALHAALGAAVGGELTMPAGRYFFSPGPMGLLGVSWQIVEGRPFLSLSADLSFAAATTELDGSSGRATDYDAFDLRGAARFGTTLFDILTPYALARAFGGPVFWRYQGAAVIGTDVSHYQVGGGFVLVAARQFDVFVEAAPLGERAVAAGAALAF